MIRLFEIDTAGNVIPTEHCYVIVWLKVIMKKHKKNYIKIYAYIFYMSYYGEENPYFNQKDGVDEDQVLLDLDLKEIDISSTEVKVAIKKCTEKYSTPISRAYKGISTLLDNLSDYMATADIEAGRDGNITALISVAKNFQSIRESFNGTKKDLKEEQSKLGRGGQQLAYDQS